MRDGGRRGQEAYAKAAEAQRNKPRADFAGSGTTPFTLQNR
jgi:hypothetical protein